MQSILIVEGSNFIAKTIVELLKDIPDVRYDRATTFAQIKEILSNTHFDLVISAFELEGLKNGQHVQYLLRNKVDVIMLTAGMDERLTKNLLKQGVNKVLQKNIPQQLEELNTEVKKLLGIEQNAILLVDDSMVARQLLSIQLTELGYTIFQAQDGKDALALIEKEPSIALVVTDYEMPGMDGLALVVNVRRKYIDRDIKIIAISGTLSDKVKQNFKNAGSTHFVSKPYNIEELKASIEKLLQ